MGVGGGPYLPSPSLPLGYNSFRSPRPGASRAPFSPLPPSLLLLLSCCRSTEIENHLQISDATVAEFIVETAKDAGNVDKFKKVCAFVESGFR